MKYPVFDIGRYPNTWEEDGMLFGRAASGVYGVLDPKTSEDTLMGRRANYCGEYPLAHMARVYNDFSELVVNLGDKSVTKVMDNDGKIYILNNKQRSYIDCLPYSGFKHLGDDVVLIFTGTNQRVRYPAVPEESKHFGVFLYHKNYGEVFLGLSDNRIERIKVSI